MNTTNIPLIRCVDLGGRRIIKKLATDKRFSCYDRQEESISLMNYQEMHYGYAYD